MLFRRRKPVPWYARLRESVWPRKGLRRALRYYRLRVVRLSATPHAIAAGLATGVAMAWTPFFGFHLVLAMIVAYMLSGNLVAAALGTALSNPVTFPLICAITWEAGRWMLGGDGTEMSSADLVAMIGKFEFGELWGPVLKPMLVGAVPFSLTSGGILYVATLFGVRGFQRRRRLPREANGVFRSGTS